MTTTSLKRRYFAKLSTNLVGLAIALVTQVLIPRGLGPKAYGDFSFLSNFFLELMPFLTLSTSYGFYTKLCQRQGEFGLVSYYFQFTGLAFIALSVFVAGSQLAGISGLFWIGQDMVFVYMAALWAMFTWTSQLLNQAADAYGVTVSTEIAKIAQKFLGMGIIVGLFLLNKLTLANFFYYNYVVLLLLIVLFVWIMAQKGHSLFRSWRLARAQVSSYTKEFYTYSHPLFIYALIGMIVAILDRWLLQRFGGSTQQGFFGLSYQIGAICFLFTSAMTVLIMREFSIAFANNDLSGMAKLLRRYFPLLFSIAAFFGCFASVEAAKITYLFGGSKFTGATTTVMIMALFPIHQTYGQLSSSIFYATGETKIYRNIGIVFMILGLPIAYFMLAPTSMMGLDAGSVGLAVKFVALQFISVNVALFFNVRFLGLNFTKYFGHQMLCIGSLVGIALLSKLTVDSIGILSDRILVSFLVSGFLYSVLVAVLVFFVPVVFGLQRDDFTNLRASLMRVRKGS